MKFFRPEVIDFKGFTSFHYFCISMNVNRLVKCVHGLVFLNEISSLGQTGMILIQPRDFGLHYLSINKEVHVQLPIGVI